MSVTAAMADLRAIIAERDRFREDSELLDWLELNAHALPMEQWAMTTHEPLRDFIRRARQKGVA